MIIHDSHRPIYREPAGPVPAGSKVTFRIRCDEAVNVFLRFWTGEERAYPMGFDGRDMWVLTKPVMSQPGLMWYDFIIYGKDGRIIHYGCPSDHLGGEGRVYPDGVDSWQITVYDPAYQTPAYMHGVNIYQIFPDRFFPAKTAARDPRQDRFIHKKWDEDLIGVAEGRDYQSTEFYGGTLNGIREKLPYLKEMGISVLYLNPIFMSASNHRYDTADYSRIDPLLGTEAELTALCEAAADMGMQVMLDGVFSHTGDDSVYFNRYRHFDSIGAYQGTDSPYFNWYTFEHFPNKYRCWWGFPTLPECRKDDPDYQQFMFDAAEGIIPRWIRAGTCGWRLDVADELSMDFLRKLRIAAKKERADAVVLGEVWEDASAKNSYGELRCYCAGDTLDSVMNYPLRTAILDFMTGRTDAGDLVRLVRHQQEVYPPQFRYALMNLLGSHDRARVLNVLAGKDGQGLPRKRQAALKLSHKEYDLAVRRLKACVDILCALPGCPTIYYGDEAGLTGGPDPYCRKAFPWGREDRDLQSYFRDRFSHRARSAVLRTGFCDIEAPDSDTVVIRRYTEDGLDALGQRSSCLPETVTVRRPRA